MNKIIKFLSLGIGLAAIAIFITGCSSNHTDELTQSRIKEDFEIEVKEAGHSYDSLDNFEYEFVEANEEDVEHLKEFFTSRVEYQKVNCSFQMTALDKDTTGYFSMIYAYNGGWQVMFSYDANLDEWEYTPKDTVSSKQMLADLKNVEFEGFEKGYVGSEKTTTLKIEDRDTTYKINKDDVFTIVTVNTDFATYEIQVEFIYYFNKGQWEISDVIVQDSKFWSLTYNSDKVPSAPKESYILEQLTVPTNFLTYVANLEYMNDYNIVATKQLAGVTSIKYQYQLTTSYNNIGTIKYIAEVPYEWVDGEWAVGDTTVKISEVNVSDMKGTWNGDNGDYIEFIKITGDENDLTKQTLEGSYFKKLEDGSYAQYNLKVGITIPLRDNNWVGSIDLWEAEDLSSVEFTIDNFSIDTKAKAIASSSVVFTKSQNTVQQETDETAETTEENTSETTENIDTSSETTE